MKQGLFEIMENRPLTCDVMQIRLKGDCSAIKKPGQFVDIKIEGLFLRRPLSVCDCEDGVITLVYKVLGSGTEKLSKIQSGSLDLLTGLGNGFDPSLSGERPTPIKKRHTAAVKAPDAASSAHSFVLGLDGFEQSMQLSGTL